MTLIFLTGAVVLALEVLSSRIMTPYFGVSLYIWVGILSITLSFLAVGYYLGGYFSRRYDKAKITWIFYLLPISSATSIFAACIIYPFLFPLLAQTDLIFGSFVASAALLALPLVCLSAMNPVLISLRRDQSRSGDGGAGQVFFVSTVGSVAGVIATAFVIIPNSTNFNALLWLALGLCAVAALFCFDAPFLSRSKKFRLLGGALAVGLASGAFIIEQDNYLKRLASGDESDPKFEVIAEYSSVFGNIKVVEMRFPDEQTIPIKAYMQDGLIQNRTTLDNVSVSMYTYVLDRLAKVFVPQGKSALVLGLGAGIGPQDLKRRGLDVTVVDINPDAVRAATEHFGFKPDMFELHVQDARTFVRKCKRSFDVVVVDLFQGDSTPDYLLTAEFFSDLRRCIRDGGAVVMNAFFDDYDDEPNLRLLATIALSFSQVVEFHPREANAFVVGTTGTAPTKMTFFPDNIPPPLVNIVRRSLESGRIITPNALLGYPPVSDRQNVASILFADAQMRKRSAIVKILPPRILVN